MSRRELRLCRKCWNVLERKDITLSIQGEECLKMLVFHIIGHHEMQGFTLKAKTIASNKKTGFIYILWKLLTCYISLIFFFFLSFFFFLGPHPWHIEVPRLGVAVAAGLHHSHSSARSELHL